MESNNNFFRKLLRAYNWRYVAFFGTLCLVLSICYFPASKNNFLIWDDGAYVKENPDIQKLHFENLKTFFTKSYVNSYVPLTMVSYAIDYLLDGLNPKVYIYTSILLHFCNAILVFWLILNILNFYDRRGGMNGNLNNFYTAAITSILFIVHPIQVESVAWIAERKNVLYSFFYLISLLYYVKFIKERHTRFMITSLVFFICSLLSKGTAVSLPLSIIAIDFLFSRKIFSKKVIIEKMPYFLLALFFGIVTLVAQEGVLERSYFRQLVCVSYGFISYLIKLLVPFNLSAFYPFPRQITVVYYASFILIFLFASLLLVYRKRMSRSILFGILFFVSNIIFMLQIIPDNDVLIADRYAYLPSVGYFLILAVLIKKVSQRFPPIYFAFSVMILIYAFLTTGRVRVWNNNYSLWDDVIQKNKFVPIAWNNRGLVKRDSGNFKGAYDDFTEAIKIKPDFGEPYNNRGIVDAQLGNYSNALADFNKAIEIKPSFAMAMYNRGKLKRGMKDYKGALADLNQSLKFNNQNIYAFILKARVHCKISQYKDALSDCDSALQLDKGSVTVHNLKSCIYYKTGKYSEAIKEADEALKVDCNQGLSYYIKSIAKLQIGEKEASGKDLQRAKKLGLTPESDPLIVDLGI